MFGCALFFFFALISFVCSPFYACIYRCLRICRALSGTIFAYTHFPQECTSYMLKVPFGNDGDFSDKAFQNRVNSNLANEVGNLAMRTLSMAVKNCGNAVPRPGSGGDGDVDEGFTAEDEALLAAAGAAVDVVRPLVGKTQQLHKALEAILQVQFIQGRQEGG